MAVCRDRVPTVVLGVGHQHRALSAARLSVFIGYGRQQDEHAQRGGTPGCGAGCALHPSV